MRKRTLRTREKENGAALVTAIFAILLTTLIGTAMHYMATVSLTVSVNERDNTEAFYIAEAGINHATALINKVERGKYSAILTAGSNPSPNTGDELSVPPVSGLWTSSESIPAGNSTSGGTTNFGSGNKGRYWVSIKNDTAIGESPNTDVNGILVITSTGVGRNGATATVETTIKSFPSLPAMLINGKARISGSVKIEGNNGALHANDILDIDGNPCADQYFSTSASIVNPNKTKGSKCSGSGVIRTNQPIIDPPLYNIRTDFYNQADYVLGAISTNAGKVYNKAGTLLHNSSTQGKDWIVNGSKWSWDLGNKRWTHGGNTIVNGTYYSEGNMEIENSFGTAITPAQITFIAEGYISVSGSSSMRPHYQNFSMVAGTDLRISGSPISGQTNFNAIHYAYHQIDLSGSPVFYGPVVAANQADTASPGGSNLVPLNSGYMKISGNPTIIANGTNSQGTSNISWREVRH